MQRPTFLRHEWRLLQTVENSLKGARCGFGPLKSTVSFFDFAIVSTRTD